MKTRIVIALLAAALLAGCATAPVSTSSWKQGAVHDYEPEAPGLGWSQEYTATQGWADVYFYDLGQHWTDASDIGASDGPFEQALQEIANAETLGYYSGVRILTTDSQVIEGLAFRHAVAVYKTKGRMVESHLYVAAYQGKLLKLRVTLHQPVTESSRASISEIVMLHLATLRRANTV